MMRKGECNISFVKRTACGKQCSTPILDSYDKVIYWINKKFSQQKGNKKDIKIDLSNTIICINGSQKQFHIKELCEKVNGFVKNVDNSIEPYEVNLPLQFKNSIIYGLNFENTRFLCPVSFTGMKIMGGARLNDSIFNDKVDFNHIDVSQVSEINFLETIKGNIIFSSILFKEVVYFSALTWNDFNNLNFSQNIYEKTVEFNHCSITNANGYDCDFSESTFKSDVLFDGRCNDDKEIKTISNIDFDSSHFEGKFKAWNVKLGTIKMENCHFYDTVNISHNIYDDKSKLNFAYTTIKSLFFIDSNLGNWEGQPIKLSEEINFYKSLITRDAFIFFRNINNSENLEKEGIINFEYANILGTITIQDSKFKLLKLNKITLVGCINIQDVDTNYDCRQSITNIKNEFIKRNDTINALSYKAKEMIYYTDSLQFKYKWFTLLAQRISKYWYWRILGILLLPILLLLSVIPSKYLEKIREYTLLLLNRISNSFGQSWGVGVLFTCMTAFIFFVLINHWGVDKNPLFEWEWNGWENFGSVWKDYLKILNVLNFKDTLVGVELNAWGETLFFISKIFIAYGIYQTISAFRKYSK